MLNKCEECHGQVVAGVLSHGPDEREFDSIERCDSCQRFGDDETANVVFEVVRWSRNIIDFAEQAVSDDFEDGGEALIGNVRALAPWIEDLLDIESVNV